MDKVIEVSSSPEPSPPKHGNARLPSKSRKTSSRPAKSGNVIELTDSETEGRDVFMAKKNLERRKTLAQAGPSRSSSSRHTTPRVSQPEATTSAANKPRPTHSSQQATTSRRVALFLPDPEYNDLPHPELDVAPGPAALPIHHQPVIQPEVDVPPPMAPDPPPPPQEPPVAPPPAANPIDTYVAQILEIIPDVQVDHLLTLIMQHLPTSQDNVVQAVLFVLFEDPTYPKVDRKGKRKRVDNETPDEEKGNRSKPKIDYGNKDRQFKGGLQYSNLALVSFAIQALSISSFVCACVCRSNFSWISLIFPRRTSGKRSSQINAYTHLRIFFSMKRRRAERFHTYPR